MSNSGNSTHFRKAVWIPPVKTHVHHKCLWWNPVVSHLMFPLPVLTSTLERQGERTMYNFSLIISSNIIHYVCFEFYCYVTSFFLTLCSCFFSLLSFCPYLQHLKNKIFVRVKFGSAIYKRQWFKYSRNLHIKREIGANRKVTLGLLFPKNPIGFKVSFKFS